MKEYIFNILKWEEYKNINKQYVSLEHKSSLTVSRWGIFVAIANNTLYGSKL